MAGSLLAFCAHRAALPRAGGGPTASTLLQAPAVPREGSRQPRPSHWCPLVCRGGPGDCVGAHCHASGEPAWLLRGACRAAGPTAGPSATAHHPTESSGKEGRSRSLLRSPGHGGLHGELRFPLSCTNHTPFLQRGPSWLPVPGCTHDTRAGGPLPRLSQHPSSPSGSEVAEGRGSCPGPTPGQAPCGQLHGPAEGSRDDLTFVATVLRGFQTLSPRRVSHCEPLRM